MVSVIASPVTPTPRPTLAVPVVLLNSSGTTPSQTCEQICQQTGLTCTATGTDVNATNGLYMSLGPFGDPAQGQCTEYRGFGCRQLMRGDLSGQVGINWQKQCGGNTTEWTTCRCV